MLPEISDAVGSFLNQKIKLTLEKRTIFGFAKKSFF